MSHSRSQTNQLSAMKQAYLALEEMQAKLDKIEKAKREPIAITGIACRFPGAATSPELFWQLLKEGKDAVQEIPPDRWDIDAYYDLNPDTPGKMSTRWGGFIDHIDLFDAAFFHISPHEAERMDPQQRLLLELSWEALEDAGQNIHKLYNSQTGVFIGISTNDYAQLYRHPDTKAQIDAYAGTGNTFSVAAGRISYALGFQGPAVAVDTACSSSLVAVHLACQSLRAHESDMALAGGVNLILVPDGCIYTSKMHAMAADGRCKTFDAAADGFVRSEGCGVIVLKRLSDALASGDPIYALIRGSAVNQDGRSAGLTVPNGQSQQAVLRRALANAGVEPGKVEYIEAHGTGTALGDPIEIQALASILCEKRPKDKPLLLGSVKTNIGHLEAAAGIAGLIKATLVLHHKEIPPHLHLKKRNPRIAWDTLPIDIPLEAQAWISEISRFAGISSFGYSGTNAHVVLEEYTCEPQKQASTREEQAETYTYLLPLSARDPGALVELAHSYRQILRSHQDIPSLYDVCYTASLRRSHHEYRLALAGQTSEDFGAQLAAFLQEDIQGGSNISGQRPKIVFVFPGQGGQWQGMGQQLLREESIFRQTVEACEQAFQPYVDWSLLQQLQADEAHSRLNEIDVVQPVLFALQIALAHLWSSWGVVQDAVIGHSMGEVAAAHIAGLLSLEDAARIICRRSQLLRRIRHQGMMALVELEIQEARLFIAHEQASISIAVHSGPHATVLSGELEAMQRIQKRMESQGIPFRPIKVDVASHSPQVELLREEVLAALQGVQGKTGQSLMYSTVKGNWITGEELDNTYWMRNVREPVLFWPAIEQLQTEEYTLFVELSPHPVLFPALRAIGQQGKANVEFITSLVRQQPERWSLLQRLGRLYQQGIDIHWEHLYPKKGTCVPLPSYPWQHQRYWLEIGTPEAPAPQISQHRTKTEEKKRQKSFSKAAFFALDPDTYQQEMEHYLIQQLAQILGMPPSALSSQETLPHLGIDSLMLLKLRNQVLLDLEVDLSVDDMLQGLQISQLANRLIEQLVVANLSPQSSPHTILRDEEYDTYVI